MCACPFFLLGNDLETTLAWGLLRLRCLALSTASFRLALLSLFGCTLR